MCAAGFGPLTISTASACGALKLSSESANKAFLKDPDQRIGRPSIRAKPKSGRLSRGRTIGESGEICNLSDAARFAPATKSLNPRNNPCG
jgi:hypothetical protein